MNRVIFFEIDSQMSSNSQEGESPRKSFDCSVFSGFQRELSAFENFSDRDPRNLSQHVFRKVDKARGHLTPLLSFYLCPQIFDLQHF